MADKRFFKIYFLIIFVLIFAYGGTAFAGVLSIKTEVTLNVNGNYLGGVVKVINKGNVPAHNVQANIIIHGEPIDTPVKSLIHVNAFETFEFKKILKGIKNGVHPLTVIVTFHDADQYPFSAVSCLTFTFNKSVNTDLICDASEIRIKKNKKLFFKIKNLGFKLKNIKATLFLPRELSSPCSQIIFKIKGRSKKTIVFDIINFAALTGGSYPVFCTLEYDIKDIHHTLVSRAIIKIIKSDNWFRRTRWFWLAGAVFIGLIILLCYLKKEQA